MDRFQPIYTETAACQDCYKCVRECPAKAIRVSGGHASVLGEYCVLCGHCVEVCPVGAKKVRSDVERAKALVRLRPRTLLSVAPSFVAEFPGLGESGFSEAARRLGFAGVSETALGADLVSAATARELEGLETAGPERPRVLLSTACPVVVDYIVKYRPEVSGLLSRQTSPMVAHGRFLKAGAEEGTAVVFVGPCIAKKREADSSGGSLDAAITFKGLRTWFQEEGLDLASLAGASGGRFIPDRASKGVLYPVDGGMIASVKREAPASRAHFVTCSGLIEVERALDGLEGYREESPIFLELLACEGGCVNGPRCEARSGSVAKRLRVLDYAREAREAALASPLDLRESRRDRLAIASPRHSEEEIRASLALVGKHRPEDELNCSGCGYDSCRAFVAAMLSGRAERVMCVSYMRDLATKKANALVRTMPSGVVVVDSRLEVVECNERFVRLLGAEAEILNDARPGLAGADLSRLLPFSGLFSRVMAEDGPDCIERDLRLGKRILHASIFAIERGGCAGGVFQDITSPSIQRDRVVGQAKAVIEKNLRTVQRIAYLLGENAADSEAILESIIDSFESPEGGEE